MEPWQRVWIDAETYSTDVHAYINCTDCHAGQATNELETAHTGLIADPSNGPQATCGNCHPNIGPHAATSLHATLAGYDTVLYERSSPEFYATLEHVEQNHCDSCHASCGDCHVSQPNSVGGGLLAGHSFVETPPMSRTCTGCHGSRVKDEYFGAHEGIAPDVHFRARMACTDCHSNDEMHGNNFTADHRYEGAQTPTCESCHQGQVGIGSGIEQHEIHGTEIVACQVCHSTGYTNCVNCHVAQTEEQVPYFTVEAHFLGFYIGRNPLRGAERPYRYVTLRHVPIDPDSFSFYGDDLLPNFDSRPTWVYATPHNIQRRTAQTASCTACHGNNTIFLTPQVVTAREQTANTGVMVENAPPLPAGYNDNTLPGAPDTESSRNRPPAGDMGSDDAFWGEEDPSSSDTTNTSSDEDFWASE